MSGDGLPHRSSGAPFNDVGFSLALRDIEVLMMRVQEMAQRLGVSNTGQPTNVAQSVAGMPTNLGAVDTPPGASPSLALPVSISNGGTGASTAAVAADNLGLLQYMRGVYVTSSTWTVPAGVYRVRIIIIGSGGGGAANGSIALPVTGGSGTVYVPTGGGGGGGGGLACLTVNVLPGEVVSFTVGAGGAGGSYDGVTGAPTTVAMANGLGTWGVVMAGGQGGYAPNGSASTPLGGGGGYLYLAAGGLASRNGDCVSWLGQNGGNGVVQPNSVGALGGYGYQVITTSNLSNAGSGGAGGPTGSAGTAGLVAFSY